MQKPLVLNDLRPRPRIHSAAVISSAANAFFVENELSRILPDFSSSDEEWLRELFTGVVTYSASTDVWSMAAGFAKELSEDIGEDHVDLFEKFVHHLSLFQDDVLRDWVSSGGARNPLSGGVTRVEVQTQEGTVAGIAFDEPRYAATGKFSFIADTDRASSISADGEITRRRILEWETIQSTSAATAEDQAVYEKDAGIAATRQTQARLRELRAQAERERNALLAANTVRDNEAMEIFSSLGLLDDVSAARAANAILTVLTRQSLERLSLNPG
ncbi:hypothetical protein G6L37_00725 [Agrobacterium rubi]|nr:hypothetical protein [Agrobacterium rubi]NTF23914.1 hypothetical protein [Agrobacterium rubi]